MIDRDALRSNLTAMRRLLCGTGVSHRPHLKAHKCLEIARLQLESGADGLCAATVGEAEALAALDTSVLLTSVVASDTNIARVVELRARGCDLTLVVDHTETAHRLSDALVARDRAADVLIDIDTGRGRSGCSSVDDARRLAEHVQQLPGLRLAGLQLYAGQLSHMPDPAERERAHAEFRNLVTRHREALADLLPAAPIVTGGSTGSVALDLRDPVLTEVQCGSYALMDVEYLAMPFSADVAVWPFGYALTVQASILSANWDGHAIADAGDKRFASKYGYDPLLTRVPEGIDLATSTYRPVSDEHGRLDVAPGRRPPPGARIECVVPHLDPSINLFDVAHVVSGDELVDVWEIDARGA
ncbi:alanine racemase [Geodermatophilus siccatus]|uniref:alanine racemase n=1 Tax=Geodermatophilus siccatus TaxID=1137991 RepID=UPI0015875AE7|nr:alanine racemase [Geodermatophilus siccatus]